MQLLGSLLHVSLSDRANVVIGFLVGQRPPGGRVET